MPDIPRIQPPPLPKRLGCSTRVGEIPHRDLRPASADLARLAYAQFQGWVVEVRDFDGGVSAGEAGGGSVFVGVVGGRVAGDAGRGLRGAVALAETRVREFGVQEVDDLWGDGGGAGGPAFDYPL